MPAKSRLLEPHHRPCAPSRIVCHLRCAALGASVTACLTQLAEGLSSKQFAQSESDLRGVTQALEAKLAQLHTDPVFATSPLQSTLQLDALCLAMQSLTAELAGTQATARGATL